MVSRSEQRGGGGQGLTLTRPKDRRIGNFGNEQRYSSTLASVSPRAVAMCFPRPGGWLLMTGMTGIAGGQRQFEELLFAYHLWT